MVYVEEYKYLHNLLAMPHVIAMILKGALLLLAGVLATLLKPDFKRGVWLLDLAQ